MTDIVSSSPTPPQRQPDTQIAASVPHDQTMVDLLTQGVEIPEKIRVQALEALAERQRMALDWTAAKNLALSPTVPETLRVTGPDQERAQHQTTATIYRVILRARAWKMAAESLLDSAYVVHGRLSFEGKAVAAAVNANVHLVRPLNYNFGGTGEGRWCVAFARLAGEDQDRQSMRVTLSAMKTTDKNGATKPAWRHEPDMMLSYRAAVRWARLHAPGVVVGVILVDETESPSSSSAPATLPSPPARSLPPQPPPAPTPRPEPAARPSELPPPIKAPDDGWSEEWTNELQAVLDALDLSWEAIGVSDPEAIDVAAVEGLHVAIKKLSESATT